MANDHVTAPSASASNPPSRFPPWRRRAYVSAGHRLVESWLDPLDARIIDVLLSAQETHGLPGGVGEIGVHHGKGNAIRRGAPAAAFFDKSSLLYGSHVEILGTSSHSTTRYRARHFVRSRPALKAVAKRVLRR